MTKTTPETTPNPSPSGAGDLAKQTVPDGSVAERIQQALTGQKAGTGDAAGAVETPEEIQVMQGGTPRKVKVAELMAAYEKQGELTQLEQALSKRLELAGNLKAYEALQETIGSMTPTQQQKLRAFFENPQLLEAGDAADDDGDDDTDSVIDRALSRNGNGHKPKSRVQDDPLSQKVNQLTEVVTVLAQRMQQDVQQQQQQTLKQRIGSALDEFQVMKMVGDEGRSYFENSIAREVAADPSADVAKLAARSAQLAQKLVDAAATGTVAQFTPGSSPTVSLPGLKPNGASLTSGEIRDALLRALPARR